MPLQIFDQFNGKRPFIMALMPVRGERGFRELNYHWAEDPNKLVPKKIVEKSYEYGINSIGIVIKDNDGACVWDTDIGWNPTKRDILGEFIDIAKDYNMRVFVSFTALTDAWRGVKFPDQLQVSRTGKKFQGPDPEMRINLEANQTVEEIRKKIPFITKSFEKNQSKNSTGRKYFIKSSSMCPRSEYIEYLEDLTFEVVKNYDINAILFDNLRYIQPQYCFCKRCQKEYFRRYHKQIPPLAKLNPYWLKFREDTIIEISLRLHNAVKFANPNCITGCFLLNAGSYHLYNRYFVSQNYQRMGHVFDVVCPMTIPYLIGSSQKGGFSKFLGDFLFIQSKRILKTYGHFNPADYICMINSVEITPTEFEKCLNGFDDGRGICIFKYYGTLNANWQIIKEYIRNNKNLNVQSKSGLYNSVIYKENNQLFSYIQKNIDNMKKRNFPSNN